MKDKIITNIFSKTIDMVVGEVIVRIVKNNPVIGGYMKIRDVYDLKAAYQEKHPEGHFFDIQTLKFFGERLSEMTLLDKQATIVDYLGEKHKCHVLSTKQNGFPGGPKRRYHYFDVDTIEHIIP
jgi:hypothetical protein